jgi:hypothetical protein
MRQSSFVSETTKKDRGAHLRGLIFVLLLVAACNSKQPITHGSRDSVADSLSCAKCGKPRLAGSAATTPVTAAKTPIIAGFASIPWGATEDEIIRKEGKPSYRQEGRGLIQLVYDVTLVGEDARKIYNVASRGGLIRGSYFVDFREGVGCLVTWNSLRSAIAEKYPTIKPKDQDVNGSTLNFCDGVSIGMAFRQSLWRDPVDPRVQILMYLMPNKTSILVMYEGPESAEWASAHKSDDERF